MQFYLILNVKNDFAAASVSFTGGGNGSKWLTEWQRLLTPDLKRREKDLFLLVETTLACISGDPPARL